MVLLLCGAGGCRDTGSQANDVRLPKSKTSDVDISSFSINRFQVGDTLPSGPDSQVERAFRVELANSGISISHEGTELVAIYIDLRDFDGKFSCAGEPIAISTSFSPSDIRGTFGEPYWQHKVDGDTLYFYESQTGRREVIFTFDESNKLGFVDISNVPIFSDQGQRERYGVDKPWPPNRQK